MSNLDRLAAESCVFERCYVTQPVCTHARSSILTGLYPHANKCWTNDRTLPPEIPCLPEMIADVPFRTGYHGKWHLGDEIFRQHGFDEWVSIEDQYFHNYSEGRDPGTRSSYHQFLIEQGYRPKNGERFKRGETADFPEEVSKPAFLAREASRFLRENRENPFILFVNFLEPHYPYKGPRDGQYDPATIPLPENFEDPPGETEHLRSRYMKEHWFHLGHGRDVSLKTREDWRAVTARYWGNCSLVDTHAGRILDELDNLGLREDTIVVFTSDHGT